jgi:uncharacterized protein YfaP (DUF2135 family)
MAKTRKRIKPKTRNVTASSGTYSRRVHREKKKVMNQTITIVVVAIVILLAFIFVIIPGFFRITSDFFDSSTPFQQADEIAPQVPIISAPPTATSSASIKVTGFGEPESELILVLNGRKDDSIKIESDGSFEVEVVLEEGENNISAYSIDEAENESTVTREYKTLLDTEPPELEIIEPVDGSLFQSRANQSITLKGKTDVGSRIYVNKRVVFPDSEGEFEHTFRLEEGENKIEVVSEDKAKNSAKIDLVYNFKI